jgi:hypothetical protein
MQAAHAGLHGAGVIELRDGPLPRNPNGKIDRKTLSTEFEQQQGAQ